MKTKYIGDSILGGITINDELIFALFETKEFKRLGRINHLGLVHYLYPTAQHNRLEHSLGVYELTRRILENLNPKTSKTTVRAVLACALLHDIGHGPYSHLFEFVSSTKHEYYSIAIIKDPNSEIYKAFEKYDPKARKQVVQILNNNHPLEWCNQMISSEIDMDRLDYLLRDSHSTGVFYGYVDWKWLLKNATLIDDRLVFKEKALAVIESMLLGRFHMNISIYWNIENVANQRLYTFWFNRMKYLHKSNKLKSDYQFLKPIFEDRIMTTDEFYNVDDSIVNSAIKYSTTEDDKIIREISTNFLRQQSPTKTFCTENVDEFISNQDPKLEKQTWEVVSVATDFGAYQKASSSPSLLLTKDGKVVEVADYSSVISNVQKKQIRKLGVKL